MKRGRIHRAFTLIELLVVITIIVILIALLVPSLKNAKALAKQTVCAANQRSVARALRFYASDNNDFAVPISVSRATNSVIPAWGGPLNYPGFYDEFWMNGVALGQYISNNVQDDGVSPTEWAIGNSKSSLRCPADEDHDPIFTSYSMCGFEFAQVPAIDPVPPFNRDSAPWSSMWRLSDCQSESSYMVVVDGVDGLGRFNPGYQYQFLGDPSPDPITANGYSAGSPFCYYNWSMRHRNGTNISFVDGHVEWMQDLGAAYNQGLLKIFNPRTGTPN